ncbi:MAG: hypothetical protein QG657_1935, partial [Acidobacteriota bacterium]|nr:hypothetical protein [Acidobacteriota bacterium]
MFKLKRNTFLTLSVLIAMFVISQAAINAATLDCPSSATLEELYDCIYSQMRDSGDGIIVPTAQQLADLRIVMGQMLDGQTSITLPASLSGIMAFRRFTDSGNSQTYSVLMEVEDADSDGLIDRGFGTFIVYNEAEKEMNIASPHPRFDQNTGYESIRIFKYTSSRSFSLAGTHRHASSTPSSCQSSYMESDAAHNEDLMFFAASQELMDYYGASTWFQVQYHGMAIDSCATNVFMSHGEYLLTPPQGDTVYTFRNNVVGYNPSWDVDIDGATACTLDGGTNTSGRLFNGVAASQVCGTQASNYGETFIHIEQDPACRTASDWIAAVNDTFTFTPPDAPGSLSAAAVAYDQIDLTWVDNSEDETLFYIERSTNGTDFSQIDSVDVDETSYSDTTVAENTTYWYRVKAGNSFGYSSYSNIANDTTPIQEWTVLTYDDFEVSFGNYTDGGGDCALYTGGSTYAHQGTKAADIQDNSGTASSFYHTAGIDVHTPGYTQIKVEFWFKTNSMETNEDFWVQYYNGSTWTTVATYKSGA